MIDANCWLITGPGGSRIDFVAGWLGTLPGFINTRWSICPYTGLSRSDANLTKELDYRPEVTLSTALSNINVVESALTYVGVCHGRHLNQQVDVPARIFSIVVDDANWKKVNWEFVIKTYFTEIPTLTLLQNPPSGISNEEKLLIVNQRLSAPTNHHPTINNSIPLEYKELFKPGGSRYLCNILGLEVNDCYHDFYQAMLPVANSLPEYHYLGKLWRFSDY
jgi:hypothetical protein